MKEMIFAFVNQYVIWGILLLTLLAFGALLGIRRQLKKLNRNLGIITGKIQEYFQVILAEDSEEGKPEVRQENWKLTGEEREMLLSDSGRKGSEEEEAVFHAVMQEYFS